MKAEICGLLLILLSGVCHCQYPCSLNSSVPDKYFPDLFSMSTVAFQLAVDFTVINEKMTDYFVEYYDKSENKGRIDRMHDDDMKRYYYYSDGMEAFELSELKFTCEERNETAIPDFMELGQYEWYYNDGKQMIHGPSAMFKNAYVADKKDHSKVVFMGKAQPVRGIEAEYWRRCLRENLTADYYFSAGSREGVYGVKNLTFIPLRVQVYGQDDEIRDMSKELLPQNYEIMTFTPFLDDPYYTFELPVGMGCGRKPREDDNPIPSFGNQNLFIRAEVIYTDYNENGGTSYSSDFRFVYDIDAEYLSYFYTPWETVDGQVEAGYPVYVVFDRKNKYVFKTTYLNGSCEILGVDKFIPKYTLPGGNKGYVPLTDPSVFYPNDEFMYLGEGMDRGYKVDIYEVSYAQGYLLGDRVVTNAVATHYYLKADEFKDGPRAVEQALTRIRISFNGTDGEGRKVTATLNFNLYDFSTGIAQKATDFYIAQCFADEDDFMFVSVGFAADEDGQLDLITEDLPSVAQNAREFMNEIVSLPPARLPQVFIDIKEALYVNFIFIDRPPFQLDFNEPKADTVISGATEIQGITLLPDCAQKCFEGDYDCWGFAYCGATCYIGAGDRGTAKLETKPNCQYYNRTNFEAVPSLKKIKRDLERAVEKREPVMPVAKKGGGEVDFKPVFIGDVEFGESSGLFDIMGMETNPRLRVVKIGFKLKSDSQKSFGSLTYGECQRLCLDYKDCETVSYCLSPSECILSTTHGEDFGDASFGEDGFCNVLTRKYSDAFIRSPGEVLSQSAKKVLDEATEEDCAKACMKESSFDCLSFDNCRTKDGKGNCRLHAVHTLDTSNTEVTVSKEKTCGHYSRKYTYDFKRQTNRKAAGNGFLRANNVNVEQCAKFCLDYNQGECNGFDSCQGKGTVGSCIILTDGIGNMKTSASDICDHFERSVPSTFRKETTTRTFSYGMAGGVGFLLFVIGCVLGALIVYGVAYYRVNKRQ